MERRVENERNAEKELLLCGLTRFVLLNERMERKGRSGMKYARNGTLKRNAVNEAAHTAGKEQSNIYALHR